MSDRDANNPRRQRRRLTYYQARNFATGTLTKVSHWRLVRSWTRCSHTVRTSSAYCGDRLPECRCKSGDHVQDRRAVSDRSCREVHNALDMSTAQRSALIGFSRWRRQVIARGSQRIGRLSVRISRFTDKSRRADFDPRQRRGEPRTLSNHNPRIGRSVAQHLDQHNPCVCNR